MSTTDAEKIKERLGIADVVSGYVKLERSGTNFKAACPFHHEKTPSFFVSPTRNTYYCFGCGEKGDIFTFVQQFEGLDFSGALRQLADRAGVQLSGYSKEGKEKQNKLYEVLEAATLFFEKSIEDSSAAQEYLKGRGLKEKTIQAFRVGNAPDEWRALFTALTQKGYSVEEMEKAGLIKAGGAHGYYDRFRSRIIFPISDSSGRIRAFSGRIFPDQTDIAKYINSPETELFNKSETLYGIDKAKFGIRKFDFSIIVEGQVDVLMAHQVGYVNTVAISGTALTPLHLQHLERLSKKIVFAFDADVAGISSTGKSAALALARGMDVKVAAMQSGVDPADLAQQGSEKLKEVIGKAAHVIDFYLTIITRETPETRARNAKVRELVLPFIAVMPSKLDQSHFVNQVAVMLDVNADVIWDELRTIPSHVSEQTVARKTEPNQPVLSDITRKEMIERKLASIILWQEQLPKPEIDTKKIRSEITESMGKKAFDTLLTVNDLSREESLFMTEAGYTDTLNLEHDMKALLLAFKEEHIKDAYKQALLELREAERGGDEERMKEKLGICKKLGAQLQELKVEAEKSV